MSILDLNLKDYINTNQQSKQNQDFSLPNLIPPFAYWGPNSGVHNAADEYYQDYQYLKVTPVEGWDSWARWVSKTGEISAILTTRAKNAMCYTFTSQNKDAQTYIEKVWKDLHLNQIITSAYRDYETYGRTFIEPVEYKNPKPNQHLYAKIKRLDPASIRVFRDTKIDIDDLKGALNQSNKTFWRYRNYIRSQKENTGDTIIAYVQNWDQVNQNKAIFFLPSDLMFIPRNPAFDALDGIGLPRENFLTITTKLKTEHAEGVMCLRHIDPILNVEVPEKWWRNKTQIILEIKKAIRSGLSIFYPAGFKADVLETNGAPEGVLKCQEHNQNQFISGMGYAKSFTDSNSSNRSVGDIQLIFYERNIQADRNLFAEYIEARVIDPLLKNAGYEEEVHLEFEDLTVEDKIEKCRIMVPILPYMTKSVIIKFLSDMGYPPDQTEIDELMKYFEVYRTTQSSSKLSPSK